MSNWGALAEAFRRNERLDRGIGAVTGSLQITTGVDVINSVWLAHDKSTAPEATVLSWSATNNLLTIYAWSIAAAAPTITVTNALSAAAAVAAVAITSSPQVYHNTTAVAESHVISGGTISAIDISRDGSTYYSTTQTAGQFLLQPGDYIEVTYSGNPTTWERFPAAALNVSATSSAPAVSLTASSTAVNVSWGVVGTSFAQHPYPGA